MSVRVEKRLGRSGRFRARYAYVIEKDGEAPYRSPARWGSVAAALAAGRADRRQSMRWTARFSDGILLLACEGCIGKVLPDDGTTMTVTQAANDETTCEVCGT